MGDAGQSKIDTAIRERAKQHDNQPVGALRHKQSTRSDEEEEVVEETSFSSSSFFDAIITATEAAWPADLAPADDIEAPE